MDMRKKRILYISSVLPDTSCGAHIAIYRHFVAKNDFDITVCGYVSEKAHTEDKFTIVRNRLVKRFFNSRFSRIAYNIEYLFNWYFLPRSLVAYAREFRPDAIFTVPDNMHSGLAYQLSKKLALPLIVNFQDLFPLSRFIPCFMEPYGQVRKLLLNKFRELHRKADLAFYTSEGMQEFFAGHRNGHVLYPVGDFGIGRSDLNGFYKSPTKPIRILYAGNCYGAYGRMLLSFSKLVKDSSEIHLKIFPVGKGWSDQDIEEMKAAGIYQSFLPFEELKVEFSRADAFLTVMSFEDQESSFVRTSFTTKWLDYAPYGKPIFVWGPGYSSAVKFAIKYNSGIVALEENPESLESAILAAFSDSKVWRNYGQNAKTVSEKVLNPSIIHSVLVREIHKIV